MKDTSLRVPSGMTGTVIDVQVFTRDGVKRDKRAESIIADALKRYRRDLDDQLRIVERDSFDRLRRQLAGHKVVSTMKFDGLPADGVLTPEFLASVQGTTSSVSVWKKKSRSTASTSRSRLSSIPVKIMRANMRSRTTSLPVVTNCPGCLEDGQGLYC